MEHLSCVFIIIKTTECISPSVHVDSPELALQYKIVTVRFDVKITANDFFESDPSGCCLEWLCDLIPT